MKRRLGLRGDVPAEKHDSVADHGGQPPMSPMSLGSLDMVQSRDASPCRNYTELFGKEGGDAPLLSGQTKATPINEDESYILPPEFITTYGQVAGKAKSTQKSQSVRPFGFAISKQLARVWSGWAAESIYTAKHIARLIK